MWIAERCRHDVCTDRGMLFVGVAVASGDAVLLCELYACVINQWYGNVPTGDPRVASMLIAAIGIGHVRLVYLPHP